MAFADLREWIELLRREGVTIHVLRLTVRGNPHHPLRLRRDLLPVTWDGGQQWTPPTEVSK